MSVEVPIYINEKKIGHLEVTRRVSGDDGVHHYRYTLNMWPSEDWVETFSGSVEHTEADGVLPLLAKTLAAAGVSSGIVKP